VKVNYRTRAFLRTNTILAATGICALLALPAISVAAESAKSLEALAAETATTAAQHQSLAAYYRVSYLTPRGEEESALRS
jgi:hypothetical protein